MIDSYAGKYHTLELETYDDRLIRAALKYNILQMKANANACRKVLAYQIN